MSKKTTIKQSAAKVSKKDEKPVEQAQMEVASTAEVAAEPAMTTTQAAAEIRSPREKLNGVTRPRPGKCGDVWEVCDELLAAGKPISFEAIRAELPTSIADATVKTQRQRHRTFRGLGGKTA